MTIGLRHKGVDEGRRKRRGPATIALLAAAALVWAVLPAYALVDEETGPLSVTTDSSAPGDSSDWIREAPADADGADLATDSDRVLELPQAIDPQTAQARDADDTAAQSGDDAAAQAGDGSMRAGGQVNGLDDYQNGADAGSMPVYLVPVPGWRVTTRPLGMNPAMPTARGMNGMLPGRSVYMQPSGISPIMPTSPMLTTPSGSGAMPGGWWTRTR